MSQFKNASIQCDFLAWQVRKMRTVSIRYQWCRTISIHGNTMAPECLETPQWQLKDVNHSRKSDILKLCLLLNARCPGDQINSRVWALIIYGCHVALRRPIGRRDRHLTRFLGRLHREPIAVAPAQGRKMEDGHRGIKKHISHWTILDSIQSPWNASRPKAAG